LSAAAESVEGDVKRNQRDPGEEAQIIPGKAVRKKNARRRGEKDQADGPLTHALT